VKFEDVFCEERSINWINKEIYFKYTLPKLEGNKFHTNEVQVSEIEESKSWHFNDTIL
jgi:hypothetical protein